MAELFDLDSLDEDDPFEIDAQAAHLFKHPHPGVDDVLDVWASDPLFYPAKPPAHWLMVAEVGGRVLVVPDRTFTLWRSRQVPTHRLLRGIFGPRHHLPQGP
ncbi:MAG TPA: hypothetical protein VES03_06095 [Motilibacterales bacterium]|nr:hypothetical protein [Motilibacterales bacterium]